MKKLFLGALLLLSTISFGQDTIFKFTKESFTDYLVVPIEGKTQSDLYKKTLEWVQVVYNTPSEVLKGQIENEYIRIEGVAKNALCVKAYCNTVKYQIEISLKDGKYKFDATSLSQYVSPSQYTSGGWYEVSLYAPKLYYKENGDIRSTYSQYPENIEAVFNNVNESLKSYLNKNTTPIKNKDW